MATLQPIVPSLHRGATPAVVHPTPQAEIDEPFLAGCRRRAAAFAADLRDPLQRQGWLVIGVLTALLVYSYLPGLLRLKSSWDNPQYSHGWIVPLFALGLLFWWRQPIGEVTTSARLAGLGLLVGSFAVRLFFARYRVITLDMYTFVPALAGGVLLGGGWKTLRWAWAPIAFLIFMYPLPEGSQRWLLGPLQTVATVASTFALQTFGFDAFREGNQITVGGHHLNVVDACSGLRMLTIFVALSVALVLLGNRERWENAIVIASAFPIALIVNAIRITVTGMMYTVDAELADKIFHDWAGYFMMPLALGMLFFEQQILAWLVVAEDVAPAAVTPRQHAPAAGGPAFPAARNVSAFPALAGRGTSEKAR